MDISLLNCLIEAEQLICSVDEEVLDDYAQQVTDWQHKVEVCVAQLPRPLSESHQQAIHQLMTQNETIIDNLTRLKARLHKGQQQLLKRNVAVHAYASSSA